MGGRALGVTEIPPILTSTTTKRNMPPGGSRHVLPAKISSGGHRAKRWVLRKAHMALGCRGVSRTDFRYDDTGGNIAWSCSRPIRNPA